MHQSAVTFPELTPFFATQNQALVLGKDAPRKLVRPSSVVNASGSAKTGSSRQTTIRQPAEEITFRTIAEEYAAARDLLFIPLHRSHDRTGSPLFRVSKDLISRGGLIVYVGQDAVFAVVDGVDRAVTLEDMVKMATAKAA